MGVEHDFEHEASYLYFSPRAPREHGAAAFAVTTIAPLWCPVVAFMTLNEHNYILVRWFCGVLRPIPMLALQSRQRSHNLGMPAAGAHDSGFGCFDSWSGLSPILIFCSSLALSSRIEQRLITVSEQTPVRRTRDAE